MPTYMNETVLTENIRLKVSPAMRQWLELAARYEQRSMGQIIREHLANAMRVLPYHVMKSQENRNGQD